VTPARSATTIRPEAAESPTGPRAGQWVTPGAIAATAGLILLGSFAAARAATPDDAQPVARVNGRFILRRDFELAVQLQFSGRSAARVGLAELRTMRVKVLERLIDGELLYQKASRREPKIRDAEVEDELKTIRGRFSSEEAFQAVLEETGTSKEEFREQIRRSLVIARFVDREIVGDIEITEEDLRRYYDQNPTEMIRRESVPIRQILIRLRPNASEAARIEARRKIEAILEKLNAGEEFADLARRYSEGPGAEQGGDRGVLIRGGGAPPVLERAAFQLGPQETSDIIESRRGFHIIKVGERRAAGPIPFDEAKESIRARLTAMEREEKMRVYLESLRETARIERLLPGDES
jgi:parvulin-like peptidyl-prolyl isomerase